jgi:hypothetical protein
LSLDLPDPSGESMGKSELGIVLETGAGQMAGIPIDPMFH